MALDIAHISITDTATRNHHIYYRVRPGSGPFPVVDPSLRSGAIGVHELVQSNMNLLSSSIIRQLAKSR